MYCTRQTEHHHMVTGFYHGLAGHKHSSSVAYQSGYGHITAQTQASPDRGLFLTLL